jgi:hypothetical protein
MSRDTPATISFNQRRESHAVRNREKIVKLMAKEALSGAQTGWFHTHSMGQREMQVYATHSLVKFYDGSETSISKAEIAAATRALEQVAKPEATNAQLRLVAPPEQIVVPLQMAAAQNSTLQEGQQPPRPVAAQLA